MRPLSAWAGAEGIKKKIGVYAWYNTVNGGCYIGSGNPLNKRLMDYFEKWYLTNVILRALVKYGMFHFELYILEYTEAENLLSREHYWIDLIQPKYNILKIAGSSQGYKHTPETKAKLRELSIGIKNKEERKKNMSLSHEKENNSFYGHKHTAETKENLRYVALQRENPHKESFSVKVLDLTQRQIISQ